MSIDVGEVIAVRGTQITLRIFEESSLETLFYDGDKYKGVSIREYLSIQRGFRSIVCMVEGEFLDENRFNDDDNKKQYIRKVEVKPIGYFEQNSFYDGVKVMPMIKDKVYLLNEKQVSQIFSQGADETFKIGNMLKEDIPVFLPWSKIFNSHIGIFGNTGSGKSNTLTKLYTELFEKFEDAIKGKSTFLLIDFNGEYTGNQLIKDLSNKQSYKLKTRDNTGDKFPLPSAQIWNTEILALLFQATANTQTPFLNRVVEGRKKYQTNPDSLAEFIKKTFRSSFVTTSQNNDALNLLKVVANHIQAESLEEKLSKIFWFSRDEKFACKITGSSNWEYFDEQSNYHTNLGELVDNIDVKNINSFDELVVRINLQLLQDLIHGYVQYDHIQPLLKRVESALNDLTKIFNITDDQKQSDKLLNVISLRDCNQATKKIVPLLLAKMFYQEHRNSVSNPVEKTLHFIIDEAHNILSQQSNREHESWKDYRLEMFEEIIKEGRKFGMFLTLSSQRPADISPTIMSQLHNFFIHRLVNDKDLFLIDNTISTLDRMSKSLIPNLAKGSCVVTGTAFDLPVVMQVDYIENKEDRPDSDDVDLVTLWTEADANSHAKNST